MIESMRPQPPTHRRRWQVPLMAAALLAAGCSGEGVSAERSSPTPTSPAASPLSASPSPTSTELSAPRPRIVWEPIPFPDSRKQEMLAYALDNVPDKHVSFHRCTGADLPIDDSSTMPLQMVRPSRIRSAVLGP